MCSYKQSKLHKHRKIVYSFHKPYKMTGRFVLDTICGHKVVSFFLPLHCYQKMKISSELYAYPDDGLKFRLQVQITHFVQQFSFGLRTRQI